jgi:hypothetical protein
MDFMTEKTLEKHTELITTVNSWLEAHREYRAMYDKKMAFDFDFLRFFKPGENKISEILAYFLDPKRSHGQGDTFLKIFVESLRQQLADLTLSPEHSLRQIKCEFGIEQKRRIDLLMEFDSGFLLAIENKIWAMDQREQLRDYANYLQKKRNENYLLVYLSPYGRKPSSESITDEDLEKLKGNKIHVMSYREDFFGILDKWIGACEAENVAYFLRQFKKHLSVKFIGSEPVLKTKKMEELVYKNRESVVELMETFRRLEEMAKSKLEQARKKISLSDFVIANIAIEKKEEGISPIENRLMYKIRLKNDNNAVWIQLYKRGFDIFLSHYFEENSNSDFATAFLSESGEQLLKKTYQTDKNLNVEKIVELYKEQVNLAISIFSNYLQSK